ncbi:MAG: hypothetical protein M3537_04610, partial [Chloroflexota bacterium]|nr:hypothetical protein [Chloroflexota bacterium]
IRHVPTVGCDTHSRAATSLLVEPSAQPSTILDRNAKDCDDYRRRPHHSSCSRSSEVNSSNAFGRAIVRSWHTQFCHLILPPIQRFNAAAR